MKYEVEVYREQYLTVAVEAKNKEQARKAVKQALIDDPSLEDGFETEDTTYEVYPADSSIDPSETILDAKDCLDLKEVSNE